MKYTRSVASLQCVGADHAILVYASNTMEQNFKGLFSHTAALKSYTLCYFWMRASSRCQEFLLMSKIAPVNLSWLYFKSPASTETWQHFYFHPGLCSVERGAAFQLNLQIFEATGLPAALLSQRLWFCYGWLKSSWLGYIFTWLFYVFVTDIDKKKIMKIDEGMN